MELNADNGRYRFRKSKEWPCTQNSSAFIRSYLCSIKKAYLLLSVLCVSSERSERVVKKILATDEHEFSRMELNADNGRYRFRKHQEMAFDSELIRIYPILSVFN